MIDLLSQLVPAKLKHFGSGEVGHSISTHIFSFVSNDKTNRFVLFFKMSSDQPFFMYTVSFLSAIGGFLFGYDTGIVSGAMVLIRKQLDLDDVWQELIVSITIGMAWIFSSIAGFFTDRYGRRPVILLASAIFTAGSVVMAFAMEKWSLLIGRAIVGVGIGLASMVVPMYIAEVAPDELRGSLVMINNCFVTGGQFIASVIAGILSYFDHDLAWR
uniref:Major facilitator superfamily (MFS) profile domain-containing protein n=1 Tax=Tetranychus urticae TaxID=32264 RepID=T1K8D2_TETUR